MQPQNIYSYYGSECRRQNIRVFGGLSFTIVLVSFYLLIDLSMFAYNGGFLIKALSTIAPNAELSLKLFLSMLVFLFLGLSILPFGLSVYMVSKVLKKYKLATDLSALEVLPANFFPHVMAIINRIYLKMPPPYQQRLSTCELKLFLERKNHGSTPCMIASSRTISLILPLGFFKIIKSNPDIADAMIAHELGHFFHNDHRFLLIIKSFLKSGAIINIIVVLNLLRSGFCFFIMYFPSMIFGNLVINYLSKTAMRAELLADLFAALTVGPAAVKKFLGDTDDSHYQFALENNTEPWYEKFKTAYWMNFGSDDSLYPSNENRIKLLNYCESCLSGKEKS